MPFRDRFDCLWCGTPHVVRSPADLEGWAQLCPTCLGRAGSNAFLRGRLRAALADRAAANRARPGVTAARVATAATEGESTAATPTTPARPAIAVTRTAAATVPGRPTTDEAAGRRTGIAAPAARTQAFPDDWFLRRGAFERGAIHDAAWAAELDLVTRWLDALPLAGRIDEPAAGTGFFSPLLAEKGELHASDEDGGALDRARERLVAHRLLAHLHVADPWVPPGDGPADAVVAAFLLGRVRGAGLDRAVESLRDRLRDGGRLAVIELLPDAAGGPPPATPWAWHDPAVLETSLARAGFDAIESRPSGRFFLLLTAIAR